MSLIAEVRREFDTMVESAQMENAFLYWKTLNRRLGRFTSFRDLLDHSIEAGPPEDCLSTLCDLIGKRRGQSPKRLTSRQARAQAAANCARIFLLCLYLPKLVVNSKAVRGVKIMDADEIEAELAAGVLEAASEPSHSEKVSGRIERRAINRLRRAVRRALAYRRRWGISLSEETHDDLRLTWNDAEDWLPFLELAQRRGEVSVRGMQLIVLTRRDDLSIEEAAKVLGINPALAYHDRRRAEIALVNWLATPSESDGVLASQGPPIRSALRPMQPT